MDIIKIKAYLDKKGFRHAQKGFLFTAQAIQHMQDDPTYLSHTIALYGHVALMNDTTTSRVERAIRHSIETSGLTEHITNSEFIARAVDELEAQESQPTSVYPRPGQI